MKFTFRRWVGSENLILNNIIFSRRLFEWIIVSLDVFKIFQLKNIKLISCPISDFCFSFQAKFNYIEELEKITEIAELT